MNDDMKAYYITSLLNMRDDPNKYFINLPVIFKSKRFKTEMLNKHRIKI